MERCSSSELRREGMEQYGFGPEAMKRTRVCSRCGTATTSGGEICPVCGAPLPEENLYERYRRRHLHCPCCGAVLAELSNFCPQCGERLK